MSGVRFKDFFDAGSAAYFSCHRVLSSPGASVDRVNVFICVNTVFLFMPLSERRATFLICDTWARRNRGGNSHIGRQRRRVWFSFVPVQRSWWPRELTVFLSVSSPLLLSTVPEISLWFTTRGMYFLWPVDSLMQPLFLSCICVTWDALPQLGEGIPFEFTATVTICKNVHEILVVVHQTHSRGEEHAPVPLVWHIHTQPPLLCLFESPPAGLSGVKGFEQGVLFNIGGVLI